MKTFIKISFITVSSIIVIAFCFLYWAHLGSTSHEAFIGGVCSDNAHTPKSIRIVTYNIANGRGSIPDGVNLQNKQTMKRNLNGIADFLRDVNADIVFLQEVDFASKRSDYINQAKYLTDKAGYSCFACVTNWVKNYIPYPYWPISQHFGQMKSGQCILSKFPVKHNQRVALPQRQDKPFYYTAFYYDDAIQSANIEIDNRAFVVFNVHQEAINIENKEREIRMLIDAIKDTSNPYVIVAGDFNALPPIASLKNNFPDLKGTPWANLDVTNDRTMEYFISSLPNFVEAIPKTFTSDNMFTFPADSPNRRLDYIFFSKSLKRLAGQIMNPPGAISDHRPLYVELEIN